MKIFIVEDETPAANRLAKMVAGLYPNSVLTGMADSIEAAVRMFPAVPDLDLVFMDIQLADGISFDIFNHIQLTRPVIFTTAYDQYTLQAFKVNSIDYLLKPIDEAELKQAIDKHLQLKEQHNQQLSQQLAGLLNNFGKPVYRERLLIKKGQQYVHLKTTEVAYFYADDKLCFAVDFSGQKHLVEQTLTQMEEQLPPSLFFRINRHMLVQAEAIKKVHTWTGSRLKLEFPIATSIDTIVSREKVSGFKEWLGG